MDDVQYKKYRNNYKSKVLKMLIELEDIWKNTIFQVFSAIKRMPNNYEKIYLAISEGEIIGFVYGYILQNGVLLPQFLYVNEAYRNKGIASELLKRLESDSNCVCSVIWYHKSLSDFYKKQNYDAGGNLEVALKELQPPKEVL
ncbi:MAG: GNAT family N-acetyltransferase [Ruminococcaceae bacterium]|nr:GNAT family N-acetyltransferase [Oscillospiraceae bacterium]